MTKKRILPLGFIDRATDDGAIIMLTEPSESHTIRPETPVTLQARSTGEPRATARARGLITRVGYVTATCKIIETRMTSKWPRGRGESCAGEPQSTRPWPGSFVTDPARTISQEKAEDLSRLATRYRDITRAENVQEPTPAGNRPETARPPPNILTNTHHSETL